MAASSEKDCPLTNLVFDLRNHDEQTRKRLKSAADFVLRHAFDNPCTNPMTLSKFPTAYMVSCKDSLASFMAAKLFALNMLHLEDTIAKYCTTKDLLQMSDQDLNSIIEEFLKLKEQRNKQHKEPTYPKGTGMTGDVLWTVIDTKFHAPNDYDSSSDLCHICKKEVASTTVFILPYCQHEIHTTCFKRRVAENPLCPICQSWALPVLAEYPNWIKDSGKVREFLNRGSSASFLDQRYIISVSVFHALMVVHLEDLGLEDVLNSFQEQIHTIMKEEKETRIKENDMIRKDVVEFLKDCRDIKEEDLVKRFHSFMEEMFRDLRLDYVYQIEFWKMMMKVNVNQLENRDSIKQLSRFVQAVKYVQG